MRRWRPDGIRRNVAVEDFELGGTRRQPGSWISGVIVTTMGYAERAEQPTRFYYDYNVWGRTDKPEISSGAM
jgi:hypothetical protein